MTKQPVTIAAEIGMGHDGQVDRVAAYARAVAGSGADVLKLQCHLPEESSPFEQWRVPPASGEPRQDYWRRTAWTIEQWRDVVAIVHAEGLQCVIAPFSRDAIARLSQIETMDGWKVPSGLLSDPVAIRMIAADRRPVWLSSGLSAQAEVNDAWEGLYTYGASFVTLQCTSLYPCPAEWSGLGVLRTWIKEQGGRFGWSDHTGDSALVYAAVALGASVVEVHVELGTEQTPDTSASWSPAKLAELVAGIRRIEAGLACDDKTKIAGQVAHLREFYCYTQYGGRVAKHHGRGEALRS
jgi:N,N'-diacetyllegionaminate synthase